jgi:predicted TIM-barrel fold metal-dependent hydrolase
VRRGLRILDADAHVVEPAELFAPWTGEAPMMDLPATTPFHPCGDLDLVADQLQHGFDAPSYLRAMDSQGIDAVVLYPSIGLFAPFQPQLAPEASAEACRAYNDWIAAYCEADPSRLAGAGILPLADVELAAAEAAACAERGLAAAMVRPNRLYGRNLGDPELDPLYESLCQVDLALSVHEGLGVRGPTLGADRFTSFVERHACSHPMEQMAAMVSLVMGGALQRHPALRVAFLESGTGWLPYWLHRLDEHHEWLEETECSGLPLRPSEYFARQCVISTDPDDQLGPWVMGQVGADHLLWASDFPHPDAIFPEGADTTLTAWLDDASVGRTDVAHVLWETPLGFYRLQERFG